MPMLIVLMDAHRAVTALDVTIANRLASLGVTQVTIARDNTTEAVVLEGWAFDVAACGPEASALIAQDAPTRSLQPVLQTLITPEETSRQRPRLAPRDHTPTDFTLSRNPTKGQRR